jgi:carbohydrate diacid regulator
MENTTRFQKIAERLEEHIKKDIPNLYAITGKMGVQMGSKKWYWESAKKAAETNTYQKEGEDIFWIPLTLKDEIIAVCGIKGHKKFPKEEAELIKGLLDEIAYDEFLERQINQQIDQKSNFIKELLETEKYKSYEDAIDRGDILGINLRSPQAVILIKTPGLFQKFENKFKDKPAENRTVNVNEECNKITEKLTECFENYEQNIFSCIGPDLFVCLKWARGQVNTLNSINFFKTKSKFLKEVTRDVTGIEPTIGVGQYYPGVSGLRKSFSDAKVALELGEKLWGPEKIYHIADVGMFVALSTRITFDRKCELAYQIMGKIFSDDSLYKTVNIFLENDMNLSEAAKKLHLHRNTLIYRLDKIKKLIGLDPRKFSDAIKIKLGLVLYGPTLKPEAAKTR